MDAQSIIIVAIVVLAILGVWLLPLRKRWNDDGADDRARAEALAAAEDE